MAQSPSALRLNIYASRLLSCSVEELRVIGSISLLFLTFVLTDYRQVPGIVLLLGRLIVKTAIETPFILITEVNHGRHLYFPLQLILLFHESDKFLLLFR